MKKNNGRTATENKQEDNKGLKNQDLNYMIPRSKRFKVSEELLKSPKSVNK